MTLETINGRFWAWSADAQGGDANPLDYPLPFGDIQSAWFAYAIDTMQRSILFWDAICQRGNIYLEHRAQGEPPILDFAYEIVLDARNLQSPGQLCFVARSALPGMTGRSRKAALHHRRSSRRPRSRRRRKGRRTARSESLRAGHPTYFVMFYPEPMPNQTLGDVATAEARFVEEVTKLHPESGRQAPA